MSDENQTPEQKIETILDKVVSNKKTPIILSDYDKETFFKCFLSDTAYSDTLDLCDGKIKLTFKSLLLSEQENIFSQVAQDEAAGINVNTAGYINKVQFYRLVSSFVALNSVPFAKDASTLQEKIDKLHEMPTAKVFIINKAFVKFEEKVEALAEEVTKENF